MKCQHCDKPATFHITELIDPSEPASVHLCEDHARVYLAQGSTAGPVSALAGMLAKQLKIEQAAQKLSEVDQKTCPACGITFAEFRQGGRLGCGYDYVHFQEDLEPLLINIHGATEHIGKRASQAEGAGNRQHEVVQLRKEMKAAIEKEDYETAGKLRDQIREIEAQ
ncbi:MAG: UvrB/UvrC motif-containing protein [Planctomycetota bacterium]|nr:UvrB/UvrC motif-containing protein [Planctomycetota bacterium]